MAMYLSPAPTGFDTLKQYLDAQLKMSAWEVVIDPCGGAALKDVVTAVVGQHGPALIPCTGPHCVVITEPDENGAVVCDPSPDRPDRQTMTWADIGKMSIGGLLYLRKKTP